MALSASALARAELRLDIPGVAGNVVERKSERREPEISPVKGDPALDPVEVEPTLVRRRQVAEAVVHEVVAVVEADLPPVELATHRRLEGLKRDDRLPLHQDRPA